MENGNCATRYIKKLKSSISSEEKTLTRFERTHDYLYLDENRYEKPKQLHLDIIEHIKNIQATDKSFIPSRFLDVGCAAGEFVFSVKKFFHDYEVHGLELLPDLIKKAKKNVRNVEFFTGDISEVNSAHLEFYDIVTCIGVLSIFDDFTIPISNLLEWCKTNGLVIIHSLFSDYPFDVRVYYNESKNFSDGILERGWNIFSKETVSRYLENLICDRRIKSFEFFDFEMHSELDKRADLVRSWTLRDDSGKLHITNGLNLLQPHSILVIRKL